MMIQKSPYSFLTLLVKGQDHDFFKLLTGVFCTVGGTLVVLLRALILLLALWPSKLKILKNFLVGFLGFVFFFF